MNNNMNNNSNNNKKNGRETHIHLKYRTALSVIYTMYEQNL